MPNHPLLKAWRQLGVSYRIGAEEMGVPRSVLHGFLHGQKKLGQRSNPEPVIRAYLESKKPSLEVISEPLAKKLFGLGLTVKDAVMGMAHLNIGKGDLYRYLAQGKWPNQQTVDAFRKWLEQQKQRRKKKMITKVMLSEEILEHFGLKTNPFPHELKSVEDIVPLKDLALAEKKILSTINHGGFCGITGCTGSGKTVLLKKIEHELSARKDIVLIKPRTVEKQYLGASGLCDAILEDLHWPWSKGHRLEMRARYVGQALEHNYRNGKKVILIIDEAHLLTDDALLALKRFYEFELGFRKLLAIVLVGQEKLAERLQNVNLVEIAQRIDLFGIKAMNGQFARFLKEKLARAGMNGREIFDSAAMKAIYEKMSKAGGFYTPQSLQNLAAQAMVIAEDLGEKTVTAKIIQGIPEAF